MFGEVYLCRFPYTDGVGSKVRPSLVLFDFGEDAIVCRVTGRLRVGSMNVAINDWSQAGLLKPSIVRLDKIITAERSVFLRKLGVLSDRDLEGVRSRWNEHLRL
jgi:mRNA interferase MazF